MADRVLTDGDVEAIAEATAARLAEMMSGAPGSFALVDARQLARDLGVSLDYVYAHATELGAMRLGSGPKARIRFDLDRARQALQSPRSAVESGGQTIVPDGAPLATGTNRGGALRIAGTAAAPGTPHGTDSRTARLTSCATMGA